MSVEEINAEDAHENKPALIKTQRVTRRNVELCSFSYFSLVEPDGGVIDVKRSFVSERSNLLHIFLLRLVILIWSTVSIVVGAFNDNDEYFFLAYLSNWTALVSLSYLSLTLWLTIRTTDCAQTISGYDPPSITVRVTWALYSIAAPAELTIILLFWALDYDRSNDGPVTYCMVFEHGILSIIVLLDGNLVGRIPLRLKHFITFQVYNLCYLAWTVIFANCDFGESPIYDVLDWNHDAKGASLIVSIVLILICPFIFILCWWCSFPNRRLLYPTRNNEAVSSSDML